MRGGYTRKTGGTNKGWTPRGQQGPGSRPREARGWGWVMDAGNSGRIRHIERGTETSGVVWWVMGVG